MVDPVVAATRRMFSSSGIAEHVFDAFGFQAGDDQIGNGVHVPGHRSAFSLLRYRSACVFLEHRASFPSAHVPCHISNRPGTPTMAGQQAMSGMRWGVKGGG